MRIKKPFRLSHVALYSKGWYETSDDVVSDLIKILNLDDYSPFDKNDVLIGLRYFVYMFFLFALSVMSPRPHLRGVGALKPGNCSRFAYVQVI
jgi:hypothetical protein